MPYNYEGKSREQLLAEFRTNVRNRVCQSDLSDQNFWTWLSVEKPQLETVLARLMHQRLQEQRARVDISQADDVR